MSAAKFRLGNLVGIVDSNGLCVDGRVKDVMPLEPLMDKWQSFGWDVCRIDGHNLDSLRDALSPRRDEGLTRPRMVIADTVKGKGVSFMEDVRSWHSDAITEAQFASVLAELGAMP